MKRFRTCLFIFAILGLVAVDHSLGSRPVPKTITGCVTDGTLISSDGYEIRVRELNLASYEGKRIQVRGNLLPGDNFFAEPGSVKVLGECGRKSKRPKY
jgi:hypothetical protein